MQKKVVMALLVFIFIVGCSHNHDKVTNKDITSSETVTAVEATIEPTIEPKIVTSKIEITTESVEKQEKSDNVNIEYQCYYSDVFGYTIELPTAWLSGITFYEDHNGVHIYLNDEDLKKIPYTKRLVSEIIPYDLYKKEDIHGDIIKYLEVNGVKYVVIQSVSYKEYKAKLSDSSTEIISNLSLINLSSSNANELQDIKNYVFEYGDLSDYIGVDFLGYNKDEIIEYFNELNMLMDNCNLVVKDEYEHEHFIIVEVNTIIWSEVEQTHLLGWEKENPAGGIWIAGSVAGIDGYLNENIIVADYGTSPQRVKEFYDLSRDKSDLYIGAVSTAFGLLVLIPDTDWILLESPAREYCEQLYIEPQSEIAIYNPYIDERVILFETDNSGMRSFEQKEEGSSIYSIMKTVPGEDWNSTTTIESEIDINDCDEILNNITFKDFYQCQFDWDIMNLEGYNCCYVTLYIRENYLHPYDFSSFEGIGTIVQNVDERYYIKNDLSSFVVINSDNHTTIIYGVYVENELTILANRYVGFQKIDEKILLKIEY